MNDELIERIRSLIHEELECLSRSILPQVVQTEIEFALRRDASSIERCIHRGLAREAVNFVHREMPQARAFPDKFALLEFALSQARRRGLWLEFGVYRGDTINYIAERLQKGEIIIGFDSFEGLPEDWRPGYPKGAYKVQTQPQIRPNVRLVKGWFDDTLPAFVRRHKGRVVFLHIDADLYRSAVTIFDHLADRLQPGAIIVFDEFFNYPGWKEGEYKAFLEFTKKQEIGFTYLGYTQGKHSSQVAVKLTQSKTRN